MLAPGKRDGGRRGAAMDFLQPASWQEALDLRAERPDAVAIAGGTDVMVDINFDRRRPGALLDLGRVTELREWTTDDGSVRLGAGVPYGRIVDDPGHRLPGPAVAAPAGGAPQNRGGAPPPRVRRRDAARGAPPGETPGRPPPRRRPPAAPAGRRRGRRGRLGRA